MSSSTLHPLSSAQQGLWYAQRVSPDNAIFNTAHYTDIQSPIDTALFTHAVNTVLAQAEILRLRVIEDNDGPKQHFDAVCPTLEINTDFNTLEDALAFMQADRQTAVDPRTDAIARFVLLILPNQRQLFYMRVHHLAADGYAMNLLEARCIQHYLALLHQQPAPPALHRIQQVLADDLAYQNSPKKEKDNAFWIEQLQHKEDVLSLSNESALSADHFLYAQHYVGEDFRQRLLQFASEKQCSWADVLTLLTAVYIARHSGQYDSVFGVPYMGRMGNSSALAIATVMNVAPLALDIDEKLPIDDFLIRGSKALLQTRRHGRYRSEQLRRDLGLLAGMRRLHGPLINILPFDTPYANTGLEAQSHVLCAGPVEDINFTFRADTQANGMRIEIEANPTLYDSAEIQAHAARLIPFIERAMQAERLVDVATLSPAEQHHYVVELNQTQHPVPRTTLSHLCAQTAKQHPSLLAIADQAISYNYQQYQRRVNQLATQLHTAGVKRGDIVAVAMHRRVDMVLVLHAIMRVGAAYLPLDLSQPKARRLAVLEQATPRLCISDEPFAHPSELACPLLALDALPKATVTIESIAYPQPEDAAYVLFTSGSTGTPKGVVISHQAIVNRLLWMRAHYQISPATRFIQKTPYTFDVSVWELFLPFISGSSLFVAPPEAHKDPHVLANLILDQAIDVIHFVPSMLAAFLADKHSQNLRIPLVFCSGEALAAPLRNQFYERIDGELHNLYGPTEAAVDVSYWHASNQDHSNPIPIGFPVWNTALYIVDDALRPVPAGVTGHLYLAGMQLADGYLNRPDLTAASFIPNPFSDQPSTRIYKTGDLARWRSDGAVEYLGRSDHQVKLRGLRIELGEIEHVLLQHPEITQAVVIVREDQPQQQHLVAYVVSQTPIDSDSLLQLCRTQLPDYMEPNAIVFLDALPLNNSGKLDRKALPIPQRLRQTGTRPTTKTEKWVAGLFKEVLQLNQPIFCEDNFFALGGHSLLAAQLTALLRQSGHALNLGVVFAYPTVAQLAHHLTHTPSTSAKTAGFDSILSLHQGDKALPALFCIHPAGGLSWCYGALARSDLGQRSVYGLQSSTFHNEQLAAQNLKKMAYDYADQIQSVQPHGPYHLLGWSVGGIIAHAIAVELQSRQCQIGVLCLLDAYPSAAWRAQPLPAANAVYKALLHIAGFDPDELPHVQLERQSVIDFLRSQHHPLGALEDMQLNGVFNAVASNNQAVRDHKEEPFFGEILYFQAELDHTETNLSPEMWQPWATTLNVHGLPFLHAHLTGPEATAQISPILNRSLALAEQHHLTEVDL